MWSHLLRDIDKVEGVQRFFTRLLPGLRTLSYPERLQALNLESLEVRRIFFDILLLYKMMYGLIDIDFTDFFTINSNNTRGHNLKINVQFSRINYRKYFFINRIVNIWNSLPANLVEISSINVFKQQLKMYDLKVYCRGRALMT